MFTVENDVLQAFDTYFPFNPVKHGLYQRDEGITSGKTVKTFDGQPVTSDLVRKHLNGKLHDAKAMGYLPGSEASTTTGCIDLDAKDYPEAGAIDDARLRVRDVLVGRNITPYFEQSSRGNGWHIWVFLAEPLPYAEMKAALKGVCEAAGLPARTETFPKGNSATSSWVIMPYARAGECSQRLGLTYLMDEDGQAIPYDELDEWIFRSRTSDLLSFMESKGDTEERETALDLGDLEALRQAALNPPASFPRHEAIAAFLNLTERVNQRQEMADFLLSEPVYSLWIRDNSRTLAEWEGEVKRWLSAKGNNRHGFPFLKEAGFKLPKVKARTATRGKYDLTDLDHRLTEVGNSEALAARHGHNLRYSPGLGWLVWDEKRWQMDTLNKAKEIAKEVAKSLLDDAKTENDNHRRGRILSFGQASLKQAGIKNMLALAESLPELAAHAEAFDTQKEFVNLANGTFNLITGVLQPHDRSDLITKLLPVHYTPDATCPKWLAFQQRISDGDETLMRFKQKAYGYALSGDTSEQAFFILWGSGANGKSTELEVIGRILDDYASGTSFNTFLETGKDNRGALARLKGTRFVSASESDEARKLSEGVIKSVTGGEAITAKVLYKDEFTYYPEFKLFLATNHKPEVSGTDHGIWRRIRLIPYNVTIPAEERNPHLKEELFAEAEGILNWLLEGYAMWQAEGLGTCEAVEAATAEYRTEQDVIKQFVEDCCLVDPNAKATSKSLYASYCQWVSVQGAKQMSPQMFGRRLKELGFADAKVSSERGWHGIGLLRDNFTL